MLWLKHDDTPVDITITYYIFLSWQFIIYIGNNSQVKVHKLAYSAAFNFITRFWSWKVWISNICPKAPEQAIRTLNLRLYCQLDSFLFVF